MYIIYILAGAIIGAAAAAWAIGRRLAAGQKENARLTVENSQQATELRLTAQRLAEAEARLAEAQAEAIRMQRQGFYLLPVRPPTVPAGTSRLRISLHAACNDEEIDRLIVALTQKKEV